MQLTIPRSLTTRRTFSKSPSAALTEERAFKATLRAILITLFHSRLPSFPEMHRLSIVIGSMPGNEKKISHPHRGYVIRYQFGVTGNEIPFPRSCYPPHRWVPCYVE